jgi:transmembrane sensor
MVHPQTKQELQALISRYLAGKASTEEIRFIDLYYAYKEGKMGAGELSAADLAALGRRLHEQISQGISEHEGAAGAQAAEPNVISITARTGIRRIDFPLRRWWWAAAAILVLMGGAYIWRKETFSRTPSTQLSERFRNDVAPGSNKAVLTLANGSQIILDSAVNGALAQEGNTRVLKRSGGSLVYDSKPEGEGNPLFNTLTTPRGGQYQLTLPDGSKVWLDAASSIRYPTAFMGRQRSVAITGQAYFEVTRNTKMPFRVRINQNTEVEVLGTHFNINAYENEEAIKTTLLEGAVKVIRSGNAKMLLPGQQAAVDDHGDIQLVENADVDAAVAWKEGFFDCNGLDIKAIMRQVGRWYDIDVSFDGPVTSDKFAGKIPRSASLVTLLKVLESSDVHFKVDNKSITVMP